MPCFFSQQTFGFCALDPPPSSPLSEEQGVHSLCEILSLPRRQRDKLGVRVPKHPQDGREASSIL